MNEKKMEKIVPLRDHSLLNRFALGEKIEFQGKPYAVLCRATLASGEPALVLQGEGEQFVIGASKLLAGMKRKN